ncbi:MAG: hypothetical protein AAGG02_07995 [Cyanobacteria bacterium P01_H01_bin.15]
MVVTFWLCDVSLRLLAAKLVSDVYSGDLVAIASLISGRFEI